MLRLPWLNACLFAGGFAIPMLVSPSSYRHRCRFRHIENNSHINLIRAIIDSFAVPVTTNILNYLPIRIYIYMHVYIRTYIHTYVKTYTHIHTYIPTYMQTNMHACIHIQAYIHTYIQTDRQTYIHTCLHACMHVFCVYI